MLARGNKYKEKGERSITLLKNVKSLAKLSKVWYPLDV